MVADGLSNRDIAQALKMSERTVEWNLTRAYRKLGMRSRAQLAATVARGGVAGTTWAERPIVETGNAAQTDVTEDRGMGT